MYANKNKSKDRTRNIARGAESTKLSSTDSRYDAGDYEAVPASVRKVRDQRNKELEEAHAIPAEEIIARQEAEIAELKRQAEATNMTNKYKSVLDDEEEHPTFKNPDSMADFGDYEAVAASARFDAANHDPNQKVFRAKPQVSTRKVAKPSDLSPGDYEAVAAGARRAVPPDEYEPVTDEAVNAPSAAPVEEPAAYEEPAKSEPVYTEPEPSYVAPEPAYSEPEPSYVAPEPAYSEPEPAYTAPEPVYSEPEPAYTAPEYTAPAPPPAPVSAADYVIQTEPVEPAYTAPEPAYTAPEPTYTAPESSYTAPATSYTAPEPTYTAPEPSYTQSPSGRKIARVTDIAPGDYEAVANTNVDDSVFDFADGSYDFDKFLANAPSLRMNPEPAVTPEESEWANLGDDVSSEPDITDEQTRALTEAIAQETLKGQPGTQFEDIIDNVIAKVLERKKAEEAAKAPAKPEPPKQEPKQEQKPAPAKPEEPAKQEQPAQPEPVKPEEPAKEVPQEPALVQPAPTAKKELTAACIPDDAAIDDIPALIVAELDSVESEVTDDDIKKVIDSALISRLANGELTLDSVGPARDKVMSEIKEMQEEEARILAELSGEKHEFRIDFIPKDAAVEDIPGIVLEELEKVEGEVPDDDIRKSIDTALIAKITAGDLTLDSFQEARDSIFTELCLMPEAEEKAVEEPEEKEVQEPAEEPETEEQKQPEPEEEEQPESEEPAVEAEPVIEEPAVQEELEPEQEVQTEPEEAPDVEAEPVIEEPAVQEEPEPEQEVQTEPEEAPDVEAEPVIEEPETEPEPETLEEPVTEEEPAVQEEPAAETEPEVQEEPAIEEASPAPSTYPIINTENIEYKIDTPEPLPEEETTKEDDEDEEEFKPIPVPKEPTVLEYDPIADAYKFSETDKVTEDDTEKEAVEEASAEASEDIPEETEDVPEETVEIEEEKPVEEESDNEEYESVPLSAAAVIANQNQEEAEVEDEAEAELEEPPAEEPSVEEEADEAPVEEEPVIEEEAPDEEISPTEEESENIGMQMTFDDIFRNPFINDFEPAELFKNETPENEPAQDEVEQPAEVTEESEETEESEVAEEPEKDTLAVSIDEDVEIDDIFIKEEHTADTAVEKEPEEVSVHEAEPEKEESVEETEAKDEPVEELEADAKNEPEEKPKRDNTETLQKYGVNFVDEAEAADEHDSDEYAEAKEKRHNDMQDALLMAMVDEGGKTFGETVKQIMDKEEINQKTLLSRMPINKNELKKIIDEPDYRPDKKTAIAICFALRLTWEDSIRLLYKAGHVLSDAQRYDLTIEYLMRRGVYDQNMINSVLLGSGLESFGIPQSEI